MASQTPIKLIDTIEMAQSIYVAFKSLYLPQIFYKHSHRLATTSELIKRMEKEAMAIEKKHRLSYSFKSHAYYFERINMTCGYKLTKIEEEEEEVFVCIEPNDDERINRIRFVRKGEEDSYIRRMTSIADLLSDVEEFVVNCGAYIYGIAGNYRANHNKISFESALSSTLEALAITGERHELWVQPNDVGAFRQTQDYLLVNSDRHGMRTKIYLKSSDDTHFPY